MLQITINNLTKENPNQHTYYNTEGKEVKRYKGVADIELSFHFTL